jgi:hypothetical protein
MAFFLIVFFGQIAPAIAKKKRITWAQLLKRVFKMDMETCNVCGGKMAIISAITDSVVIQKILDHLKLPTKSPKIHPSRGPPRHQPQKGPGDDFIQTFPDYD